MSPLPPRVSGIPPRLLGRSQIMSYSLLARCVGARARRCRGAGLGTGRDRRRRHVPGAGLCQVGRRLQQGDRRALNYQSVGSGAGIQQIKCQDRRLRRLATCRSTDDDLAKDGLIQFPTVIGGVVPVVNIKGIAPGQIKLTGQVLGDIYLGKITKWNDAALTALNPGVPLPDAAIASCAAPTARAPVHLHELPVEGECRLEGQGRRGHGRQLADRRRRQGQRRRRRRSCSACRTRSATSSTPTPSRTR